MTASLADEELSILGKMNFNDQFSALNAEGGAPAMPRADLFEGLDKQTFLAQRVHRKLQPLAASLSDEELSILGKMKFNDQFSALNAEGGAPAMPREEDSGSIFNGASREEYMQQRVHRKLPSVAATLSDEELAKLGQMKFNSQFPALNAEGAPPVPRADLFGGLDRATFVAQRVHRKLHPMTASLADEELSILGK